MIRVHSRLSLILSTLALILFGAGCSRPESAASGPQSPSVSSTALNAPKAHFFFYIAVDVSGSIKGDDDSLHQYLRVIGQLCESRAKYGDRYALDDFANDVQHRTLDSAIPYFDTDGCLQLINEVTKRIKAGSRDRGTFFEKPFRRVIQVAKDRPNDAVVAILLTDGLVDDPEASQKAAKELSTVPNIRYVVVCPVTDRRDYAGHDAIGRDAGNWSCLKNRLKLYTAMDFTTALPSILNSLGGEEL